MGMFASLSGIIGKSQAEIVNSLRNYAQSVGGGLVEESLDIEHDNFCSVESSNGNTTIHYPHGFLEWDECSAFLSKELNTPVFSFHIHDGDLWMYILYVNGEDADQFNPIPDYWDENISEEEMDSWKGDATTLAQYIPGLDIKKIERYLVRWDIDGEPEKAYEDDEFPNEDWQLVDFMKKIGLKYPREDHHHPSGQSYKLWTRQLRLQPENTNKISAPPEKKAAPKPWWKFWVIVPWCLWAMASPAQTVRWQKHVLTNDFISEGVAVADVNKDGKLDILAGAWWFEAPGWTKHAIAEGKHWDPSTQFSNSFLDFAMDVNQDGWVDMIRISLPGEEAVWYENPGKTGGYWPLHPILKNCGNESPALADVDGDGRPDLLCNDPVAKEMIWLKSPSVKGDTTWKRYVIARGEIPGVNRYTHGLGLIDMNGDGRRDVVITRGWWECPLDPRTTDWTFHPADLGQDCSQIYALDKNNLISASAHRYGIWWHEKADTGWVHHTIYDKFSETHALAMADINGDGRPDLITGKRYYAHNGEDPGAHEPSVLYWFERKPGPVRSWIPHQIDDNSGVGLQVLVQDINKDGLPDIIVANKKGVFFFEQRR